MALLPSLFSLQVNAVEALSEETPATAWPFFHLAHIIPLSVAFFHSLSLSAYFVLFINETLVRGVKSRWESAPTLYSFISWQQHALALSAFCTRTLSSILHALWTSCRVRIFSLNKHDWPGNCMTFRKMLICGARLRNTKCGKTTTETRF